jgi:hypothetical protein
MGLFDDQNDAASQHWHFRLVIALFSTGMYRTEAV